jgi:AcrR family transcriptional regulator
MPPTSTRRDAQRSREAILTAARELLTADADASFAEIAHVAGLGQATVYRHFADRQALLVALAERTLDGLEAQLASDPEEPPELEDLLRRIVAEQVRHPGLSAAIRRGEIAEERVRLLSDRVLDLFRAPVEAARRAGTCRPDLGLEDVAVILAMAEGALGNLSDPDERKRAAERAIEITLRGTLRPATD